MRPKPIRNEVDYDAALNVIDGLMGAPPGTPESNEREVLVTLVEAYEDRDWAINAADPISALEHVMEAHGLRQREFADLIGSQPHASEVLNRRRRLKLAMIQTLAAEWGIPAEVLVREYDLANTA